MSAEYDPASWAAATTLGRRLFNANFSLAGNEMRGWELLSTNAAPIEPGAHERIHMLRDPKARGEALVRVSLVELDAWRAAQQRLHGALLNCMRPEVPRAAGSLAKTGDVGYAAHPPEGDAPTSVFFTRGNLLVWVASVGDAAVDVSALAKKLDGLLCKAPGATELTAGQARRLAPASVAAEQGVASVVIDSLPAATAAGAWVQVLAPDGELRRVDDQLVYTPQSSGKKALARFVRRLPG